MMDSGFLERIAACNLPPAAPGVAWVVGGQVVGALSTGLAAMVATLPGFVMEQGVVHLRPRPDDFETRSRTLADAHVALLARGEAPPPRHEAFPLTAGNPWETLCVMDRALVPRFGARAFGQHVNGYVRRPDGGTDLWLGRRAQDRGNAPGRLDNMAAGGLPHAISLHDNLLKECWEEAAIPADLARTAVPAGYVAYRGAVAGGVRHDILYCYDLEVPADFEPRCNDGEVDHYLRVDVQEAARLVAETEEFKPNCTLVVIDFLVRHGLYRPEAPRYREVVAALRQGL